MTAQQPSASGHPVDASDRIPVVPVLLLGVLVAAIIATAISAQTYLSMLGHGHSFAAIFTWQLSSWSLWALAAPFVVAQAGRAARQGRPTWRTYVPLVVLGVFCVAVHVALATLLTLWLQPFVPVMSEGFVRTFLTQFESLVPVDVLVYAVLVLVGMALSVARMARRLEVRESRLEAELAKAQLEALRLEIQPHFLFNTLNAIAALIRSKSNDRALDMLLGLSELMRQTLDRTREQTVTLEAELDFTRRYVDLQQARFGDRLSVAYRIPAACLTAAVPTFLLQPLVENALRHGLGRRADRCAIEIGSRIEGDQLRIWVSDDGVGLPPGFDLDRHAGTGLRNTRSRLDRLHGRSAWLTVAGREGGGTFVEVVLPFNTTAAEAIA